jgi:Zn-finger nucleic acid-binding protein
MESVEYQGVEVDRCTGCHGIWFDLREAEQLRARPGSEAIDTGDRARGREMNSVGKVECPRCHTPMVRMVDSRQSHLWYEACTICNGMFFDAGELTDFTKETVMDRIRDLMAGERL